MTTATVAAHGINILFTPVLARLFPPEVFGVYALFASVLTLLVTVSTLRYSQALVVCEGDAEARGLLLGCFLVHALFTLVCLACVPVMQHHLSTVHSWNAVVPLLWWLPPALFLAGTIQIFDQWLSRRRAFGAKAAQRTATALVTNLASLVQATAAVATSRALVISNLLGSLVGAVVQVFRGRLSVSGCRGSPGACSLFSVLYRYRRFAAYDAPSAVLNTLSVQLAPLILAVFFTPDVVGHYARAMGLVQLPMILVGSAIAQTFYPYAAQLRTSEERAHFLQKTLSRLFRAGIFPFCLLGLAGSTIFTAILGPAWDLAGTFAQILSPWCFFVFVGSPVSTLLLVLDRQDLNLIFNLMTVSLRAMALAAGGLLGDAVMAVAAFSAVGTLLWILLILKLLALTSSSPSTVYTSVRHPLAVAILLSIPVLLLEYAVQLPKLVKIALYGLCSLLYIAFLIRAEPGLRSALLKPWRSAGSFLAK